MDKRVSADTITEISIVAAGGNAVGTPPTAQKMIGDIRARLKSKVEYLELQVKKSEGAPRAKGKVKRQERTAYRIGLDNAIEDLQKFEELIKQVPKGFRLAPVLYTGITPAERDAAYAEYTTHVRADFLRFVAENHADELKAMGIGLLGIEQMKQGMSPRDDFGKVYDINIDHVIERAGGGLMSRERSVDLTRDPGAPPTLSVNHFSNFTLMPRQIHEAKNQLNAVQQHTRILAGESGWILMIVPEADATHSGYVAQPQEKGHPLAGIHYYKQTPIERAKSVAEHLGNAMRSVKSADVPRQEKLEEAFLKPALKEMSSALSAAFNEASLPRHSLKPLKAFFNTVRFKQLALDVSRLDLPEAVALDEQIKEIEASLTSQYNGVAKKPAAKKPRPASNKPSGPELWSQPRQPKPKHTKKNKKSKHGR